jgi:hypothetical protein
VCGDLSLQRQRMKRLLMQLEREHPGVKASLLKALGNVMPRHLLDRRLNPPRDGLPEEATAAVPGAAAGTPASFGPEGEAVGEDADASNAAAPGDLARVIPLILQHAAGGGRAGTGGQGDASPRAVPRAEVVEAGMPAAE